MAKALGVGESYTATSGIPMPAALAWRWTVLNSQASTSLEGCLMICAPVLRRAIHFDSIKLMKLPANPKITLMTISEA